MPTVFDSDKYEELSVQVETVRLNGFCTVDLMKLLLDTAHKIYEDVALLKSNNASLKSLFNKFHENWVNLRDHCPTDSVCRQTRETLAHLQRPHFRIQPEAISQLQILDLRILLHLRNNLLVEELPWTLHQLFLRLRSLPSKKILMVSKLSPKER